MAGVLAPVFTQVGLQLVLQPFGNTVGDAAWQARCVYAMPLSEQLRLEQLRPTDRRHPAWLTFPSAALHRSCAVGVLYPAYASFKAVEVLRVRGDDSEAARWLTYWAVYGAFSAAERLLDKLLPWCAAAANHSPSLQL